MVLAGETVITGGPVETEKSATAVFDPPPIPPPSNPIYKPSSDERLTANGSVTTTAQATAPTAAQSAQAVQDVVAGVDLTGAPPLVRWGVPVLVLAVELGVLIFLVIAAIGFDNHLAQQWLPGALALVGVHNSLSPSVAIAGPR